MDMQLPSMNNAKPKSRKSENYTVAEDLILIAAWEHTSEDGITGTDQAKCQYWTKVWKEYMANLGSYPPRTEKSIVNRFSIIRTKCLKFSGIVQSIEYANPSGMTEQDKLNMAIATWSSEEKEKGGFKLLHCYHVLKNSPKWFTEVMHPAASKNIPASGSVDLDGDVNVFGHVEMERPIGRKAEKEIAKKRKMKSEDGADSQSSTNYRESQDLMQKMHEEKMTAIHEDKKKMEAFLEIEKEKLELERKTFHANKEWREEKLMTVDMTNLTDMQRKYVEMKQSKILEKAFNNDS